MDIITRIRDWFETAKPEEERTVRDIQVQTGVHFEEVHEMLQEIAPLTPETEVLLGLAKIAMHELAEHFKNSEDVVFLIDQERHKAYLDSLLDQTVTATGVAHYMGYQFVEALEAVAVQNESKFIEVDGKLVCVRDANGKIAKGPNYVRADLSKYV